MVKSSRQDTRANARSRSSDVRRKSSSCAGSGDESGFLLLVLLLLWYFGFVTIHSRERGRAIAQIESVSAQLDSTRRELVSLSSGISELRAERDSLSDSRQALEFQVRALEQARDDVASSLATVDSLIAPIRESRAERYFRVAFSGVPGNLVAAGMIFVLGLLGRRIVRDWRGAP